MFDGRRVAGAADDDPTETKTFEVLAVDGNQLDVRLPEGTRELTVPDDFRFTVNGQQLSVHELKVGHERHGHHHDANDGHAGHRHRGEERHRRGRDRWSTSSSEPTRESSSFTQGDVDKRGVKIMKDGKPAPGVGFPCRR